MTKYKEIIGTDIQTVTTDPTEVTGQVWYNESEGELKTRNQFGGGAWSSGGNLNNPKGQGAAAGIQTATLTFGGIDGDDGSTELAETELYNGSTWTELNDLNIARRFLAGAGTSTSALAFGGNPSPSRAVNESWNGTSWTEVADLNTGRDQVLGGAGTNTAALVAGGQPPTRALAESWNGSAWYEVNDLNTAVTNNAFVGESSSALSYGGSPGSGSVRTTESWNGAVFTESNDMSVDREGAPGGGANNTAALAFGGFPIPISATEEWNAGISVGAWVTGGNLNTARQSTAGNGTQTSTLAYGGNIAPGPRVANTESWNGTSWAEVNDLNSARDNLLGAGADSTSALAFAGESPPGTTDLNESWNGAVWTETADLTNDHTAGGGFGTSTSAIAVGGSSSSTNESWNGSSWTEVGDLNTGRGNHLARAGISNTAGLVSGGGPSPAPIANSEQWNGSAWTEVSDLNIARRQSSGDGTSTSAVAFGGENASNASLANTEVWNGSSWTNDQEMNTARHIVAGSGGSAGATLALAFGGSTGTQTNATEEWHGDGHVTEKISSS